MKFFVVIKGSLNEAKGALEKWNIAYSSDSIRTINNFESTAEIEGEPSLMNTLIRWYSDGGGKIPFPVGTLLFFRSLPDQKEKTA